MVLVGAAILPHGDLAFDPRLLTNNDGAKDLHQAMVDVAKYIQDLSPDVILLITPHGMAHDTDFILYDGDQAQGSADVPFIDMPEYTYTTDTPYAYKLSQKLDSAFTQGLFRHLREKKVEHIGMLSSSFQGNAPFAEILRWGEVYPMAFLQTRGDPMDVLKRSGLNAQQEDVLKCSDLTTAKDKHITTTTQEEEARHKGAKTYNGDPTFKFSASILSMPTRRLDNPAIMLTELITLGHSIREFIDIQTKRIVVVASADLAHTHKDTLQFTRHPAGERFDAAAVEWTRNFDHRILSGDMSESVNEAKVCGWCGMCVLQGLVGADVDAWEGTVHAYAHPTYFGMMVVSVRPKEGL
jgi:aromatic ring-opening dioxygenase LigB subunit